MDQKIERQQISRKEIIDTLELISSKKELLDYQEKVSITDVTAEIFSDWDSAYIRDQQWFIEIFSVRELQAIDMFNSEIMRVWGKIKDQSLPIEEFVETSEWKVLESAANQTLSMLNNLN